MSIAVTRSDKATGVALGAVSQTAGRTLAVFVQVNNNGAGCTLADTAGNSYVPAGTFKKSIYGQTGYWFYVLSCSGHATNIVTASPTTSAYNAEIFGYELTGVGSYLEQKGFETATPMTAVSSGTFLFSPQEAVILAGMAGNSPTFVAGAGYTMQNATSGNSATEYKIVTAAESATATVNNSNWYINAIAFGAGSPPTSSLLFHHMFTPGEAVAGSTSNIKTVALFDSTTGLPKTGAAYNTGSFTCYTYLEGAAPASRTLADMTLNAFTSLGFKQVDATNAPGIYQFCPSDADVASQGHRRYVFNGGGYIGVLDLPVFGSDALAPAVSAQDVADATRDDALDMLGTFARDNTTGGELSFEDSTGTPVALTLTTNTSAEPITALVP